MNTRGIFRPNKVKISIFLISIAVLLFIPLLRGSVISPCQIPPCPQDQVIVSFYHTLSSPSGYQLFDQFYMLNIITVSLAIVTAYALSCIIAVVNPYSSSD